MKVMRMMVMGTLLCVAHHLSAQGFGGKSCTQWEEFFASEVAQKSEKVKSLSEALKLNGKNSELASELRIAKNDLKSAKSNLKVAKKAVSHEQKAMKDMQKSAKASAKMQQQKGSAER
ncbi:MAG: hypothetical protein HUK03_10660, partial [Bacteroidaceae bacterium]|nr:hypothetical protein [Bacteroidaceae bacterium]